MCDLGGNTHGPAVSVVDGVLDVCVCCAFTARDAGMTVETKSDHFGGNAEK